MSDQFTETHSKHRRKRSIWTECFTLYVWNTTNTFILLYNGGFVNRVINFYVVKDSIPVKEHL